MTKPTYQGVDGREVRLTTLFFGNTQPKEIPCACNCNRMVKVENGNEKYATLGCVNRARAAKAKKRMRRKKLQSIALSNGKSIDKLTP